MLSPPLAEWLLSHVCAPEPLQVCAGNELSSGLYGLWGGCAAAFPDCQPLGGCWEGAEHGGVHNPV